MYYVWCVTTTLTVLHNEKFAKVSHKNWHNGRHTKTSNCLLMLNIEILQAVNGLICVIPRLRCLPTLSNYSHFFQFQILIHAVIFFRAFATRVRATNLINRACPTGARRRSTWTDRAARPTPGRPPPRDSSAPSPRAAPRRGAATGSSAGIPAAPPGHPGIPP